ncbi:hypothetical protein L486_05393 [Kwoniella mangroviensis CBS 10435]|uniref:BRCT domain-containing protein n=1 Tax=Kwoniella mangroviensis CBS 10435 TaxID=1331196 RepID=A0A1B9ILX8_9TREE|nr:hypothetical protein L486_05393 [Kwoniella mangroviensis CBS 10435]
MENPLYGHSVLFAEGQFADEVKDILSDRIIELGGQVTFQREGSTILLANPAHPSYKQEIDHISFLQKTYPEILQPDIKPYHWIANIYYLEKILPVEDLPIVSPIFVHPSKIEDHRPIKAWVSVNVTREQDETPVQARDNLTVKLECAGAVSVTRRASADLLIVDESSDFAKKVKAEKEKNNRTWQRIVERDWVDDCLKKKRLDWRITNSNTGGDSDNESFVEDDTALKKGKDGGKGPGRPAGGQRVDYTPQDDDFLCRYLAAHYPSGAWSSRKTYESLVSSVNYSLADRHTPQSWHERYRKNSIQFEKRVRGYIRDEIDITLKTRLERERAKPKSAKTAESQIAVNDDHTTSRVNEAGPSRTNGQVPIASPSRARQGKKKLVQSDDEDSVPPAQASSKGKEAQSTGSAISDDNHVTPEAGRSVAASSTATTAIPASENGPPETGNGELGPSHMPTADPPEQVAIAENENQSLLRDLMPSGSQLPSTTPAGRGEDGSSRAGEVEENLDDKKISEDDRTEKNASTVSRNESITETNEDEESQTGEATQAILADFAKAQQAATQQRANKPERDQIALTPTKTFRVDGKETTVLLPEIDVASSVPKPSNGNLTPERQPPMAQNTQSSPINIVLSPPKRSLQAASSAPLEIGGISPSNTTAKSISLQLEGDIRAVAVEQGTSRPTTTAKAIEAGPSAAQLTTSQRIDQPPETPTSTSTSRSKRKSLLHDHLIASASKRSRRRETSDRHSRGHRQIVIDDEDETAPDMVFRETSIPPRPDRITPSIPSSPVPDSQRPATREPSPPLSNAEKHEKALSGKALMERNIQAYKDRIVSLAKRYGMTTREIIAFINNGSGSGKKSRNGGERYWEEIERGLRERQ